MNQEFHSSRGCREAKLLLNSFSAPRTEALLRLNRKDIAAVTGILTGHAKLNEHLHRMGLKSEPDCDRCGNISESAEHLLCHCPFYQRERLRFLGAPTVNPGSISSISINDILFFLLATGRNSRNILSA